MASNNFDTQIENLGLNAPRVTYEQVLAIHESLKYSTFVIPDTTCTVAAAIMPNGFVVGIGYSASASPENFNEEVGRSVAIGKANRAAFEKIWELEGYHLKKSLEQ